MPLSNAARNEPSPPAPATKRLLLAVCLSGFVLSMWCFDPGVMSYDSFQMYNMGLEGRYHDWHSPVMAWLFHAGRGVAAGVASLFDGPEAPGPRPVLALQLGCWWTGAWLFALQAAPRLGVRALWLCLTPLLPPLLVSMGYLQKQPLQAGLCLLAAALLQQLWLRQQRGWRLWAHHAALLLLFWFAAATHRLNLISLPPLLAVWLLLLWPHLPVLRRRQQAQPRFRWALAAAVVAMVLFAASIQAVEQRALHTRDTLKAWQVIYYEIAGISYFAGKSLQPERLRPAYRDRATFEAYWESVDGLFPIFKMYQYAASPAMLREDWLRLARDIADYPEAWFAHRAHAIGKSFALTGRPLDVVLDSEYDGAVNAFGVPRPQSWLWRWYDAIARRLHGGVFMLPWVWCLLNLASVVMVCRATQGERSPVAWGLAISGLLNWAPLLLLCNSNELRFFIWTITATVYAGVIHSSSPPAARASAAVANNAAR